MSEATRELTDYNQIAKLYVEAKQEPWRKAIEEYSFLKLIGDVSGLRLVDLACGSGHFTRKMKQRGAADVCGVDVSAEMIKIAEQEEAANPLGIRYAVDDVRAPTKPEGFDLAVSAWLLVYARTLVELDHFCAGVAKWVKPGGRFVTFTTDPNVYFYDQPDWSKYNVWLERDKDPIEGALIRWKSHLASGDIAIDNYFLPREAYREALEKAGFRDVHYHDLSISPNAPEPAGYWDDFLKFQPAFMIEAVRG